MEYKNDARSFILQNINDPSTIVSSREIFCFWCKEHDENRILIYYNPDQITSEYLSSYFSDKDLQSIFNYLAMHEYGHTYMSERDDEVRIFTDEENELINTILYFD